MIIFTDSDYRFTAGNGIAGSCTLEIRKEGDYYIATLSDKLEGPSVTNNANVLANKVVRQFSLNPNKIIWVEHYPRNDAAKHEVTYDLINFKWVSQYVRPGKKEIVAMRPRWTWLGEDGYANLVAGNMDKALGVKKKKEETTKEISTVTNKNGVPVEFEAAFDLMDADIRGELAKKEIKSWQIFFTAYETAHAEKYGEDWELSKSNPVW